MSFVPVIPTAGLAGWNYLQGTGDNQKRIFAGSGDVRRDTAYFRDRIGTITTAEDLVSDRRLLKVALGAFGLGDDIDNKYFIRKVLEDGTLSADALANKLSDKRYLKLSQAFGFGDYAVPRTQLSDFADKILGAYVDTAFETAVGEQSNAFRLAMNADRELPGIAAGSGSDTRRWYAIMSSAPLREVFQTAFGLPPSFAAIDLDQQVTAFKDAANRYLGIEDPAGFADPVMRGKLIRLFILRDTSSATGATTSGQSAALAILQGTGANGLSLLL